MDVEKEPQEAGSMALIGCMLERKWGGNIFLFFFVSVTFLNHSVVSMHTECVNPEMKKSEFWSQLICRFCGERKANCLDILFLVCHLG